MTELNTSDPTLRGVGRQIKVPSKELVSCGDVSCEFLINPIPRPTPDPVKTSVKPKKREVVLYDNNKPNSMAIMQAAQRQLRAKGIPVRDEIRIKANASLQMSDEQMEQAAAEEALLICGVND
jgi:hypothetical protein